MKRGDKKVEKRDWRELLKNNFVSLLLLIVICMAFVFAGNVYIRDGDIITDGEGAKLCKVLIDTYEGNGTNNRELDLGDDYDEVRIYLEENKDYIADHLAEAYAIGTTYGISLHRSGSDVEHRSMGICNEMWQGKMTGGDVNKIKLGSNAGYDFGTNENGWTYRIVAKKYCDVQSLA